MTFLRPPRHLTYLAAFALLTACEAPGPASRPSGESQGAASRLVERMLGPSPVVDDLRFVCDRIGGRPTGSEACERAVDWFAGRFRRAGADTVRTENFTMPRRWEEGRSRARIITPEPGTLEVIGMPYSPRTPPEGLEARLIDLREGDEADFERVGETLRGAIGLLSSEVIVSLEDLFNDYMRLPPIVERARAGGAAGLLLIGARELGIPYRHIATFGDEAPFPMAILAREEGLRLARLLESNDVRLRLDLAVRTSPAFNSRNVVAEIRGRERSDEIVLAGAHLDSWDFGTGALDNGANCAMLLDVARQMAALNSRPRRTVRFVLFTGEEQGMFGSLAYVRAHRSELHQIAAVVIFDIGTGRITGFSLGGREDLRDPVEDALRPAAGLGVTGHTNGAFVGTDNFDFLLEGVPNLVANQEPANYMRHYHASSDTIDKADLKALKTNGAIAAALIWGLADSPGRAARLERPAIQTLLDETGLAHQMKVFGLYQAWSTGRRGRNE